MYIGLDVGGTNLVAGLVDREGRILHKAACPVDRSWTAEELSARLARLARQAAEEGGCPVSRLKAAGAGLPGLVDNRAGVVVKTPNMPFRNTPLRTLFQRELELPLYLGNDADCAAIGEFWAGSARGCDPAVVVTLGTGIGSGMVRGGKLYTGFGGAGLEAGHIVIHPGGQPCGCGNRGCWEQYGSATALIRMAREEMDQSPDSTLWQLCGGEKARVDGRMVFQAARQKDAAACRGLDHYLDGLSVGLINLANVLFPEVICLGGGISAADDDLLLEPLRERFHRGCFNKENPPRLVKASLGNDAGVVGAALLCDMV